MATSIPNMNPTGLLGSGTFNTATGFQQPGAQAMGAVGTGTGGAGNYGFGNSMNPYPVAAAPIHPGASGGVSMNPGGGAVTGGASLSDPATGYVTSEGSTTASANPYGQSQSQQNWTEKYLQKTYGGGMGSLIYQYLMSGGGFNSALTQQAVGAQTNAMQQQTQLGANNLASMMGASGVSAASSGYGQALGGYFNQAEQNINAITAQDYYNMWNAANQNEAAMMQFAAEGTGKTLANKPNWMDFLGMAQQSLGSAAQLATSFA